MVSPSCITWLTGWQQIKVARWKTTWAEGCSAAGESIQTSAKWSDRMQLYSKERGVRWNILCLIKTRKADEKLPPSSLSQDKGSNEKCLVTSLHKAANFALFLGESQGILLRLRPVCVWASPIWPMWRYARLSEYQCGATALHSCPTLFHS